MAIRPNGPEGSEQGDDAQRRWNTWNALLGLAGVVVVIAGLRAARALLLPFLFALLLSVLVMPLVLWMERRRVPRLVSILIAVLGVLGGLSVIATVTTRSVQQFSTDLPVYQEALTSRYHQALAWAERWGLEPDLVHMNAGFNPEVVMTIVGATLNGMVGLLSNTVIVTILMAFVLAEATEIPDKFARAFPHNRGGLERWARLMGSVQSYLGLKILLSAITGTLIGIWTAVWGLQFPVLLGLLAFILDFIPAVGSILAAIPAVAIALMNGGVTDALLVAVGYVAVNIGMGNVLEPRVVGDQLGLSPLAVLISVIFWGWLWGPAGMLLAVPLTVVLRSVMASREDTRWLAVLLGPNTRPGYEWTTLTGLVRTPRLPGRRKAEPGKGPPAQP